MSSKKKVGFMAFPLRYLALGLLMKGPGHGYQLDQILENEFKMIWKAGQTKLYLALSDLEEEGLLSASLEPQENRPARKVYRLTEEGKNEFLAWVTDPVPHMRAVRVELIAKLKFFDLLEIPGREELIHSQQTIFQKMIAEWKREKDQEKDPFLRWVHDFRIDQAQFILDWLNKYQSAVS